MYKQISYKYRKTRQRDYATFRTIMDDRVSLIRLLQNDDY